MIIPDLLSKQTLSLDTDGYRAERSFIVTAVGGTAEAKLYNALTTGGVPAFDDPHPIIPDVKVTNLNATPNESGETVTVKAIYSIPKGEDITSDDETIPDTISLSTSLQNEQTSLDVNGDFMIVEYKGLAQVQKYVEADVQRPQMQINFERTEATIPKAIIANYLGKINSVPWSGFPARTWLCSSINAREDKEGEFKITYSFNYRADTWRVEGTFGLTQEQIDELPPNTETENGYKLFDVYQSIDFTSLGLDF